jgi:bifunctional non-homologous end joining protein LigD
VHEVKFDGYRCQLHKHGDDVVLFSRNGRDFTKHYLIVRAAAAAIPLRSLILDGELTAYADDGREDLKALLERRTPHHLCLWCSTSSRSMAGASALTRFGSGA